jgi:hypothetical protein
MISWEKRVKVFLKCPKISLNWLPIVTKNYLKPLLENSLFLHCRIIYSKILNIAAGCEIFGISRDSLRSHEGFKGKLELPFDLISDTDETVCTMFDVIVMKSMYGKKVRGIERSTFVIDAAGKIVKEWRGVKVPGHVDEVLEVIEGIA